MSSTRQDSIEEVVTDTAPPMSSRKTHLKNGGSSSPEDIGPASPPKRKKMTGRLCETTVAEDTTHVMRLFLVKRSKSLTEQDVSLLSTKRKSSGAVLLMRSMSGNSTGDDLETDAGPDSQESSADEEDPEYEETVRNIAKRLGEIGDDVTEKYKKQNPADGQTVDSLFARVFVATAYDAFRDGIEDLCRTVCAGNDPDVDSLAFVFHLTQRFVEAAKDAGRQVEECAEFGERYVQERFGVWIAGRGGWGRILDQDGSGTIIN